MRVLAPLWLQRTRSGDTYGAASLTPNDASTRINDCERRRPCRSFHDPLVSLRDTTVVAHFCLVSGFVLGARGEHAALSHARARTLDSVEKGEDRPIGLTTGGSLCIVREPELAGSTERNMNKINKLDLKLLITVSNEEFRLVASEFDVHPLHDAYNDVVDSGLLPLLRVARTVFGAEHDFVKSQYEPQTAAELAWHNFVGEYGL